MTQTADSESSRDRIVLVVPAPTDDGHIRASAMFRALFRAWKLVGATTVVFIALAIAFALLSRPVYQSEVVATAVEESSGASSFATGQLGSLAAAAGLNLGALGSRKSEYVALLSSRAMVGSLI